MAAANQPRDTIGGTANSEAARYGYLEMLTVLLSRLPEGADINPYFDESHSENLIEKGGEVADRLSSSGFQYGRPKLDY